MDQEQVLKNIPKTTGAHMKEVPNAEGSMFVISGHPDQVEIAITFLKQVIDPPEQQFTNLIYKNRTETLLKTRSREQPQKHLSNQFAHKIKSLSDQEHFVPDDDEFDPGSESENEVPNQKLSQEDEEFQDENDRKWIETHVGGENAKLADKQDIDQFSKIRNFNEIQPYFRGEHGETNEQEFLKNRDSNNMFIKAWRVEDRIDADQKAEMFRRRGMKIWIFFLEISGQNGQ